MISSPPPSVLSSIAPSNSLAPLSSGARLTLRLLLRTIVKALGRPPPRVRAAEHIKIERLLPPHSSRIRSIRSRMRLKQRDRKLRGCAAASVFVCFVPVQQVNRVPESRRIRAAADVMLASAWATRRSTDASEDAHAAMSRASASPTASTSWSSSSSRSSSSCSLPSSAAHRVQYQER